MSSPALPFVEFCQRPLQWLSILIRRKKVDNGGSVGRVFEASIDRSSISIHTGAAIAVTALTSPPSIEIVYLILLGDVSMLLTPLPRFQVGKYTLVFLAVYIVSAHSLPAIVRDEWQPPPKS